MNRLKIFTAVLVLAAAAAFSGCAKKTALDGSYDFIIYERDSDNSDLSDNKVVASYHIEYKNKKTIPETLIRKGDFFYFSESSPDYLVLKDGGFGLSYTEGYFENFAECKDGKAIDISLSYTAVNGEMAMKSMGETPLEGLNEFGFVINGWKE